MPHLAVLLAVVRLGAPFTDGAVLQRDRPIPVWGEAAAGETVRVSFGGQTVETKAAEDGRWRVDLAPCAASGESRDLVVNDVRVRDVVVGEVWLCSGQSNMEFPLCGDAVRYRDRQGALVAQMTRRPLVRFANLSSRRGSPVELAHPYRSCRWLRAIPENLLTDDAFSAVGIYYALEIHSALDVPVGVIGAYFGGTRIEPWIPREGFATVSGLDTESAYRPSFGAEFSAERMREMLPHHRDHHLQEHQQPSVLWNSHLACLVPYAVRGVIWYQGCSNSWDYERYAAMMHALWNGWSRRFENPRMPFYFVQIAPYGWAQTLPQIQAAQARFAAEQPCAAMAVVNDLGNEFQEIHPNEKELVAKRLAVHALKRDYGFDWIQDESPSVRSWRIEGDRCVLTFGNAKSLHYYNRDPDEPCGGFEIAGEDGVWHPALIAEECLDRSSASHRGGGGILSTTIMLSAKGVAVPKRIRYLHVKPWRGALYNEVDLPLGSFEL